MTPTSVPDVARLEMGQSDNRDPETPLLGCYPFGAPGEPVVLCVGSIEGRKNHLALLDACEQLWSQGATFTLTLPTQGRR